MEEKLLLWTALEIDDLSDSSVTPTLLTFVAQPEIVLYPAKADLLADWVAPLRKCPLSVFSPTTSSRTRFLVFVDFAIASLSN